MESTMTHELEPVMPPEGNGKPVEPRATEPAAPQRRENPVIALFRRIGQRIMTPSRLQRHFKGPGNRPLPMR